MGWLQRIIDELFNRKIKRELVQVLEVGERTVQSVYDIQGKLDRHEQDRQREIKDLRIILDRMERRHEDDLKKIYHITCLLEESEKTFRRFVIGEWNKHQIVPERIRRFMTLLEVKEIKNPGHDFCRIGRDYDGGYVMYDDFSKAGIAYSFGINDDVSWDKDIAARNIDVYMYDHTIDGLPEEQEKFHYFQTGISAQDMPQEKVMSLQTLMEQNGHQDTDGMLLKIDVEGAEWDVLANVSEDMLNKFDQIVIEFHDLNNPDLYDKICGALEALNRTHQLVHIHANNYRLGVKASGCFLPDVLEGTYLLRDKYEFKNSTKIFPIDLDMPNDKECPEFCLGRWGEYADNKEI